MIRTPAQSDEEWSAAEREDEKRPLWAYKRPGTRPAYDPATVERTAAGAQRPTADPADTDPADPAGA